MFVLIPLALLLASLFIVHRWAIGAFDWAARRRTALLVVLLSLPFVNGLSYWASAHFHARVTAPQVALLLLLVACGLSSLPLALLLAISRGARLRPKAPSPVSDPTIARRQVIEGAAGAAIFGATGSAIGWGMARGRHDYQLVEVPVRIAGLARALDGYVIAHVSDIHAGQFVDERELDAGLAFVGRARPDLVVVTGDIVDSDPSFAPLVARKLGGLGARDGVFAALGNHDHYTGARAVIEALRRGGVDTLVNSGRVIRPADGGGFALLGVDDLSSAHFGGGGVALSKAVQAVPDDLPRVLLSHQPPTVDLWAGKVALQLSGHTHGGQINPGGVLLNPFFEYIAGLYRVRGTSLYVNRGLGTVGPPVRVGVRPEIARIILIAA